MILISHRFLIPRKYKITQLVSKLKKEGRLKSDRALYFFINNAIVKQGVTFGELSSNYSSEDGALYLRVTDIPTFG